MALVVILVVVCVYISAVIPWLDRLTLMKRTFFCITNKRVLTFVNDRTPVALNRAGLKFRIAEGENGCSHIAFGTALKLKPGRFRMATIVPPTDKSATIPTGTVFYNIKAAGEAASIISNL